MKIQRKEKFSFLESLTFFFSLFLGRPEKNYFFPDLHHMKFEIEDGTTVKGKEIRFGYDPEEFPSFSWRGYARMSAIQVRWYFAVCFWVRT